MGGVSENGKQGTLSVEAGDWPTRRELVVPPSRAGVHLVAKACAGAHAEHREGALDVQTMKRARSRVGFDDDV